METKKVKLGDVASFRRASIKPEPGTTYNCYSLPAFDNNKTPEILDGEEILSNKLLIKDNDILVNKLNMRFKRIWNVDKLEINSVCSTEFLPMVVNDDVNRTFIYYVLLSDSFTRELSGMRTGTSGSHQRVKPEWILDYEFNLPPLSTQCKISSVLSAFDSKIEVNNKLNAKLEEMACAVFEERFGGISDNAILSDFAEITMGQSPSGTSYNENGRGEIFYQGRGEFGWRFPNQRLFTSEPKKMAKRGDVLLSVRAPVGDLNVAYEDCCIGRGLAAIHSEQSSFCIYLMKSLGAVLDNFNGEGTVFGSINQTSLKELPIGLPKKSEIIQFEKEFKSIDEHIYNLEKESRALANLRDALLPKLMSGEVQV